MGTKESTSCMRNDTDQIPNEAQWRLEAQAVIDDVRRHVQDLRVSERSTNTNRKIYLNLTTLEGLRFCIELSAAGFTIISNRHDDTSNVGNEHFETLYSLLDRISPQYRNSFGNSLLDKLKELSDRQ